MASETQRRNKGSSWTIVTAQFHGTSIWKGFSFLKLRSLEVDSRTGFILNENLRGKPLHHSVFLSCLLTDKHSCLSHCTRWCAQVLVHRLTPTRRPARTHSPNLTTVRGWVVQGSQESSRSHRHFFNSCDHGDSQGRKQLLHVCTHLPPLTTVLGSLWTCVIRCHCPCLTVLHVRFQSEPQ